MPLVTVRKTRPADHQITFMQLARATNVGRVQKDKITNRNAIKTPVSGLPFTFNFSIIYNMNILKFSQNKIYY